MDGTGIPGIVAIFTQYLQIYLCIANVHVPESSPAPAYRYCPPSSSTIAVTPIVVVRAPMRVKEDVSTLTIAFTNSAAMPMYKSPPTMSTVHVLPSVSPASSAKEVPDDGGEMKGVARPLL